MDELIETAIERGVLQEQKRVVEGLQLLMLSALTVEEVKILSKVCDLVLNKATINPPKGK